jgi:hypothetical protein
MHSSSISKLSQFWINWKINKTTLAPVDSLTDRTALGPHRPPQIVAATNLPCQWFPAAVSLPPDSPSHRPPSTASTGYNRSPTHHEQPFFLPPVAPTVPPCSAAIEPPCSAAPGSPLSSPSPPRAPHRRVPPSRTVSHQPSPLDAAPTVVPLRLTAHRCGGPPPLSTPQLGVLCCRAALVPLLYRPRHRQAGADRAATSAAIGRAPCPCSVVMGHQPKVAGPAEVGRLNLAHLHSTTCHFSIRLNID